jgi:CheY-like chemotaxis protein/Tfp pilus assembly protein PilF
MRQIDIVKVYAQKHCLVIDDMPDIRVAITNMLKVFGVQEIDVVANGEQAMEICRSTQYDMVLCDYNLGPGMDGQQVLEELRFRNQLNNTSIFVMITAESSREMVLGALEYRPDDYVTKPITTALLRTRLDRVVLRHQELIRIKQAMDEKDYAKAIVGCDERLNDNTSYRSTCLQIKAEMNLRLFNFKQAEDIYRGVLKEHPVIWAKLGLGKTLVAKKEYDEAQEKLKEVVDADRRYVEAHDLLSETYLALGDHAKAQECMQEAANISPKSVQRQRRLAALAKLNEDTDALLNASRQAIRVAKNSCYESEEDFFNLARELTDLTADAPAEVADGYVKESFEILGRLQKKPYFDASADAQTNSLKSRAMINQRKIQEAEKYLHKAMEIVEKNPDVVKHEAKLDLVKTLIKSGNKDRANQILHELAENNPDDAELLAKVDAMSENPRSREGRSRAAHMTKNGIDFYEQKKYRDAIKVFRNAVGVFPSHLGLNLNLIQAVVAQVKEGGDKKGLESVCRKALQRVSSIDKQDAQFARYDYLRKQIDEIFPQSR